MTAIPVVPMRKAATLDQPRLERAVRELLVALGEDPEREGLRETPRRVAEAYREMCGGLAEDPARHLKRTFAEDTHDLVVVQDLDLNSLCEHHLLPFTGAAHIAYLPNGHVVGLSKLARTVEAFARRPQVQERLTAQIADAVMQHLAPRGVIVMIEAEHLCMKLRGVKNRKPRTATVAYRGVFADDVARRQEAMGLLRGPRDR
jgi:GTP cyclohydrolase I